MLRMFMLAFVLTTGVAHADLFGSSQFSGTAQVCSASSCSPLVSATITDGIGVGASFEENGIEYVANLEGNFGWNTRYGFIDPIAWFQVLFFATDGDRYFPVYGSVDFAFTITSGFSDIVTIYTQNGTGKLKCPDAPGTTVSCPEMFTSGVPFPISASTTSVLHATATADGEAVTQEYDFGLNSNAFGFDFQVTDDRGKPIPYGAISASRIPYANMNNNTVPEPAPLVLLATSVVLFGTRFIQRRTIGRLR
jgi:hypothetical protein